MSVVYFPQSFVKIARDGERFWLRQCRTISRQRMTGVVDNELEVAPYKYNDRIEFDRDEIVEVAQARAGQKIGVLTP